MREAQAVALAAYNSVQMSELFIAAPGGTGMSLAKHHLPLIGTWRIVRRHARECNELHLVDQASIDSDQPAFKGCKL